MSRAGTRDTPVTVTAPPQAASRLAMFGPVLLAAGAFAFADVFVKVALNTGADALTIVTARGVLALPLIYGWLRLSGPITPLTPRQRWISYGLGILFAGNVYFLIEAIRIITVPVAILTYFIYPLLTGLAAAATGIEKLTWRGVTAAIIAFCGLALMLGAHPTALAALGVAGAIAAAFCRVALLLVTRAAMQGADARLITWHSSISTTVVFVGLSLLLMHWQPPATAARMGRDRPARDRDDGGHSRRVRLDRAHRSVPHRAVHESRAAADRHRQRVHPGRSDHAAAGGGRRDHDRRAGGVPVAPLTVPRGRAPSPVTDR